MAAQGLSRSLFLQARLALILLGSSLGGCSATRQVASLGAHVTSQPQLLPPQTAEPVIAPVERALGQAPPPMPSRPLEGSDENEWVQKPKPTLHTAIQIEFATNRARGSNVGPRLLFTGKPVSGLFFGTAIVTIPQNHKVGRVELPGWFEREDRTRHFTIVGGHVLALSNWQSELKMATQRSGRNAVLLFVHGYRNSFDDALRRTAQIAYDIRFRGAVAMFSWPSTNLLHGYWTDGTNAEHSARAFEASLRAVITATHSNEIYIIAHSMGNRVVTAGLLDYANRDRTIRHHIRELILAAPDIDEDEFKAEAKQLATVAAHVTLYASSNDSALLISGRLNKHVRVGDISRGVPVLPPIDTVDASAAKADMLGHSYFASSVGILGDIGKIINGHLRPTRRGMETRHTALGEYWIYLPPRLLTRRASRHGKPPIGSVAN